MSSRFFARGGDSDSESSESEESLYDVDESEEEQSGSEDEETDSEMGSDDSSSEDSDEDGATGVNRFLKAGAGGVDSDDESGSETGAPVKSAKDKRLDELEAVIKKADDGLRIQDFQTAQKNYDEVIRLVPNVTRQMNNKTPKIFIKMLAETDTSVAEAYEKSKVTPKVCSRISRDKKQS
jgi:translation initiation factor 3 subunit C